MKILINTDWLKFIKDLSPEKQNEIMLAILDYPNRECSLSCWEVIRPDLEKGQISYFNRLKSLKQNSPVTAPSRTPTRDKDGDKDIDKDINKDNIDNNKGGMGGKEKGKKVGIFHLGEMNLVKLTEEENKKVMIKCHGTGRPEPSARYVLAIRKINAWMATGTKATERYKPANKTHYGLFADGNWVWDDIPYDIEKQKKFSETREDWLASINFIKGEQNDNK